MSGPSNETTPSEISPGFIQETGKSYRPFINHKRIVANDRKKRLSKDQQVLPHPNIPSGDHHMGILDFSQNFNWGSTYSDTACKEPIIHIASPQPSQPEPFLASVSSGPEAEIPVIQSKTDSVIYDALSSETETGLHLPSASAEYMLTEIESEFYPTNPFCPDTQESLRSIEGYVRREGSYLPCACGAELSHTFPLTTTPASPLTPSSNLGLVSPRSPSPSSGSVSPSDILIFTYPPFTPVEVTADEVAEVNNACLAKNAHAIYPEAEVEVRSPSSEAVHEMHSHPSHYFKDYANLNVAFYETPALDSSSNFLDNIGFESHPMLPGPPCSIVQ